MATDDMLQECFLKTRQVNVYWKQLGLLLNMEKHCLDEIEHNYPRDVATCRMEMLHAWIKRDPANPKAVLDDALKEILKNTHKSKNNHKAECMRLDGTIEEKIDNLKAEFAAIVTETRKCVKARHSDPEDAASWLNEILRGTQNEPLIVEESAPDYSNLFRQLQKKWSFTNHDLLQQLLDKLKDDLLNEKMKVYKESFDTFCHSFSSLLPSINNESVTRFEPCDPSQPCLVLIFESVSKFYDIEVFLTDVFSIHKRYLRVHKIELGSIKKVTLQFAPSMKPLLQDITDKKQEAAKHYNVTSMHIEHQTEETANTTFTKDQMYEAVADTLTPSLQAKTKTPETSPYRHSRSTSDPTCMLYKCAHMTLTTPHVCY